MSINDPLFVVAYDYKGFVEWCHRKGISPTNRAVRYVRDVQVLRGQKNIRVLFLYGWQERKDGREIYNRVMIAGRRPS